MPLKRTIEKARKDKREGKSPSTQAGEFVREEIDKIRRGAPCRGGVSLTRERLVRDGVARLALERP